MGLSSVTGQESILFADNASFDGTPRGGAMTSDGQLWIGSTSGRHVRLGNITSTGNTLTVTNGSGTINLEVPAGGGLTLGAFGSTPNANGLSLTTGVLNMQPANGTNPGGVSTTTQTFAGAKTFTSTVASGVAGSSIGGFLLSGNTSGTISILPQAAAGTFNFNLPTTAGTSGYLLASGGGGSSAMTWTTYSQGTFTPVLAFGGASTGIAYAFQDGSYTRIGNIVTFTVGVGLTNVGSATGSATITGFPFTTSGTWICAVSANALTFSGMVNARLPSSGTISIDQWASGGSRSQLSNTAFSNSTFIQISGSVLVT